MHPRRSSGRTDLDKQGRTEKFEHCHVIVQQLRNSILCARAMMRQPLEAGLLAARMLERQ
ncbi:MAG: hypothetical protein IPG10_16130 [Flavobacteriales bacterium]|nr:hypothetical protein [Flavobacteriales bacterium]MBK9538603.1 hypothetical protein [Flavobacteriales bacterium]